MKSLTKYAAIMAVALMTGAISTAHAQTPEDMGGWGLDGEYNNLYKNIERDRLKGVIEDFKEITPLPGMSPGLALIVEDVDGDRITVHLGPLWFVKAEDTGLRKGDQVKIKGVWAEIGEQDFFMAAKVKRSEYDEYKIRRTKDGFPFWAMSPEALEQERSGKE